MWCLDFEGIYSKVNLHKGNTANYSRDITWAPKGGEDKLCLCTQLMGLNAARKHSHPRAGGTQMEI